MTQFSRRDVLALAGMAALPDALSASSSASQPAPQKPHLGARLQQTFIWSTASPLPGTHFIAFRKDVTLPTAPRSATLHLFADVRYLLWVNGQYVTRGPARFNPKGPEYDTVPLTSHLSAGRNTLVALVMAQASNGKMMLHPPGLTALMEWETASGERKTLSTDESWKWSDQTRYGPPHVEWGNVRDRIDARVEDGDWTGSEYGDDAWRPAVAVAGGQWGALTPRRIPLLRETLLAAGFEGGMSLPVTLAAGQEITFDLGRLTQAYTVLDMDADADTTLSLPHAGITYAARAGRQTYLSSDTCGFQKGTLRVDTGRVTLYQFHALERLYPFECIGSFRSSDPQLDDIWAMCARSVQVMSEDSYVDCADRERTEWMDNDPPGFDITRTAFAGPGPDGSPVCSDPRLMEELLRRTALTQQPDGWVKAHTCSDRFDIHACMEDRSCDWVQGARLYYEATQNADLIREIWPVIVTQMDWFLNRRTARGLVRAREWIVWGNPMGYQTCEGTGLNAFLYKALADAAYLGIKIGEKAQANRFLKAARSLSTALNTVLWNERDGTYYSGFFGEGDAPISNRFTQFHLKITDGLAEPTMFPALFALDQGIVPDERRESVMQYLLGTRQQAARIMTFYYLFKQMYAVHDDALDKEVLDTIRTKWNDMATTGWKVSWEDFFGNSRAHIYGSFPGYFLSAYVLGVRPDGPVQARRLLVEPRLGDLERAEGTVITECGPVPVAWKRGRGRLDFHVTIPAGMTAAVRLPQPGAQPHLVVNGKVVSYKAEKRLLAFTLGHGTHSGTLTFTPPSAPMGVA